MSADHDSVERPDRPPVHPRPDGVDDATVEALGTLSEALEVIEHARGLLYGFHRLSGTADLTLQRAVQQLREAGHSGLAAQLDDVLVGRDVVRDMWTFEIVEAYDEGYWQVFRDLERTAREQLGVHEPHVFESEMKHREQGGR
ncbi:hypothetical protein PZ938_03880 [Luteipulveratus sp. YIM 133132]|uniref:hypothetical protein n=1 Tax=Luteipulveratus flavus TaxID=3031728 RepID=UPI0023AF7838|nr:hypothetical protein [Luteipulveratus sp. YIM 133132]MDE9364733.1 hypothetical protein [Luteipulveratus sp. YIM 133132]